MTPGPNGRPSIAFDEIVEDAPAAISVKDATGRYLYVNKQHEVVTGITSEETLGQTDFDLFPPSLAAAYRKNDLQTLEGMSPLRFDELFVVQGNERLFSIVKFPVLSEEQVVGVCGISLDITAEPQEGSGTTAERQSRADIRFGRRLASLTPQEVRVLDLLVTGLSDREIAEKLNLANDTVRHHVSHLLRKLRKRRTQVIIEMLKRATRFSRTRHKSAD